MKLTSYKSHFAETITLALPVVIGQLGQVLMGVLDTAMIGVLGHVPVSAAGLANSIIIVLIVIGLGLTMAVSSLIASEKVQGHLLSCRDYLQQGTYIGAIVGCLFAAILYIGAPFMRYIPNQPPEDVVLAVGFMRTISFGIPFSMLFMIFKNFADGTKDTKPAMYITIIGLLINFIFNLLLIEGRWGFPRLELVGAGISTDICRVVMFVLMAGYLIFSPKYAAYHLLEGWGKWVKSHFMKILAIGIPSGMQYFFEVGAFAGAAILMGKLGSESRSAHQIAISIASVTYMFASGIATATSIRVGSAYGHNNKNEIQKAGFSGLILVLIIMSFCAGIFIIGKDFLPALFNITSTKVKNITANLLVIAAIFQLFDGAQVLGLGMLRGIQDVKFPTLITFISYWLVCIPAGYFMGFTLEMGTEGFWYAFVIGLGLAAIANNLRFWWLSKEAN